MFWVFKTTVSLRRFFEYPHHMFRLRNKKIKSLVYTFNLMPAIRSDTNVLLRATLASWVFGNNQEIKEAPKL